MKQVLPVSVLFWSVWAVVPPARARLPTALTASQYHSESKSLCYILVYKTKSGSLVSPLFSRYCGLIGLHTNGTRQKHMRLGNTIWGSLLPRARADEKKKTQSWRYIKKIKLSYSTIAIFYSQFLLCPRRVSSFEILDCCEPSSHDSP